MSGFVVIESTPGYLPDDDDPAVFETLRDARSYARDLVAQLRDFHADGAETCRVRVDSRSAPRSWYVVRGGPEGSRDLGRVVEILDYDGEAS